MFQAMIREYQGKKCFHNPGRDPYVCYEYCKAFYEYVPTLKYKNAQKYNPETGHCEPKPFCRNELGIRYDQEKNQCYDMLTDTYSDPIDAPNPNYNESQLQTV